MAGTLSTLVGTVDSSQERKELKKLETIDLYLEYYLHLGKIRSMSQWFLDGFISKCSQTIFLNIILMWVDIKPSFIICRLLTPTHSACFLQTGPFACLPTQSFHSVPVIPLCPLQSWCETAFANFGFSEPKLRKGGHLDNSFPDSRNCQSLLHLSLCQFFLWIKLHYYIRCLARMPIL